MKILVIAHFQNDNSPCAIFVHDQVKAFYELGHRVLVLSLVPYIKKDYFRKRFSKTIKCISIDNIEYAFLRYISLSKYGAKGFNQRQAKKAISIKAFNMIKAFNPDIIHAHTFGIDGDVGVWLKDKLRCPLVITTHGSDTTLPIRQGNWDSIVSYSAKADYVVCVGGKLKCELESIGVNTKVAVIHNGFNIQFVKEKQDKQPKSILQVGNLVPSKRNDITIRAFSLIKKQYPQSVLTIIGDGPEKNNLIELCNKLGINDSVEFLGWLPNETVLAKMASSEFFVMVSSPEGFGIVYLEAMASYCLTLAAINEGISDIIVSGNNGFLLPVDDPEAIAKTIIWAMDNKDIVKQITTNGHNDAINYSWINNALRYLNIFEELTEGNSNAY